MNRKDCPAAKMACFNRGIFGHMEKVGRKPKGGSANRLAVSAAKKESISSQPEGVQSSLEEGMTNLGDVNWRDIANAA